MKKPRIVAAAVGTATGRGTAQAAGVAVTEARGVAESKAREQQRRGRLEANRKRHDEAAAKWQTVDDEIRQKHPDWKLSRRRNAAAADRRGRAHGAQAHQVKTERPAGSAFLPAHDRGIPTCATTHARMPPCQDSLLDLAETKSAPPPARKAAVSQESPALWSTRGFPAPTSMY
jgi:hypothetical protein